MPRRAALGFWTLWGLCYLACPLWLAPEGAALPSALRFALLALAGAALTAWLGRLFQKETREKGGLPWSLDKLPKDPALWILSLLCVAPRLYPALLPLHPWKARAEGSAAPLAAALLRLLSSRVPLPAPLLLWPAIAVLWLLRRRLLRACRAGLAALGRPGPWGLAAAAGLAAYCLLSVRLWGRSELAALEPAGQAPLGLLLALPLEALFGAGGPAQRLPELAFFLGGGLLIYRLFSEMRDRSCALLAAALYWLLPAVGHRASLGGTVEGGLFFMTLSICLFTAWIRDGGEEVPYWAALAAVAGGLYHPPAGWMALVLAALSASRLLLRPRGRRLTRRQALECAALLAAGLGPRFLLAAGGWGLPDSPAWLSWERWLAPARGLAAAASLPAAGFMAAGFVFSLSRKKDIIEWCLLAWCAAYYLVAAFFPGPQAALPLLPPLTLCCAELLLFFSGGGRMGLALGGSAAFYLLAAGHFAASPSPCMDQSLRFVRNLRRGYLPLDRVARVMKGLEPGTGLVAVDCGPEAFLPYMNAWKYRWTSALSAELGSLQALSRLCREAGAQAVVYAGGNDAAFGRPRDPALFSDFLRDDASFAPLASFSLGENRVALKRCSR